MNWISLKTAIRSFIRKPLLPSLNLFGLSLGIACFLTISLYIYQENTYDSAFEDNDRIYRIEESFLSMGQLAWTSPNIPHALADIALIEKQTRVNSYGADFKVKVGEKTFKLDHVLVADSSFFQVFDFPFLQGNPEKALSGPGQVVVSEEMALKLFGSKEVIGESISTEEFDDLIISGIVAKGSLKSHLDFDLLMYNDWGKYRANRWFGIAGYSYVKVATGVNKASLDEALSKMTEKMVYPVIYKNGLASDDPMSYEEWAASPNAVTFQSKPLRDIYLKSHLQFEIGPNGDEQTRTTLSIVAVLILVIAIINFMNLSTSRASSRAKEVGVKKVLGAGKNRLVRQFLWQSVLITLLAAIVGGGISELFVRIINLQLGDVITVSLMSQTRLVLGMLFGMLVLGVVAGAYPAFYLSSVKSIPLLKGKSLAHYVNVRSAIGLRNGLVVFQFIISSALIAASVIVYRQMTYLQGMDLGYEKERVLIINNAYELNDNKEVFRNALLNDPAVNQASFTMRVPSDGSNSTLSTLLDSETTLTFGQFIADEHLAETLGLELLDGEWFKEGDVKNDSLVIVNESAIRSLGIEEPVGELFGNYYRIKGVVKDFKFAGIRDEIGPAVIMNTGKSYSRLAINLNSDSYDMASLNDLWMQFTNEPLEAVFLNQQYEELLRKERQASGGVLVFTFLAIIIAALGLFGLATFSAEQRKHEFGIRRVLGANLNQLLGLFSVHFMKLIVIAFVISIPIAYYGLDKWLNGFADRIQISAPVFLIAGLLAIVVALITLAFQSIKISRVNTVETLQD